jgi:hypothetical protein
VEQQNSKEQKANLEEELRQKQLAAERAEREQIQKLEKARIDRLLGQAAAFEQAIVIRKYVEAVHNAISELSDLPTEKFDAWSRWPWQRPIESIRAEARVFFNP